MVIEREVEVEELGERVIGMDVTIECAWSVELVSGKPARLNTDVSISMDFLF